MLPILSIGIQVYTMLKDFCNLYPSLQQQSKCRFNYGITLGILILINLAVDGIM